jgi:hypothetical protein
LEISPFAYRIFKILSGSSSDNTYPFVSFISGSFRLPDAGWLDHYYTPLLRRIPMLKEKYANNADAQNIIRELEKEMEVHRNYSKEYGYTFFVLKNNTGD